MDPYSFRNSRVKRAKLCFKSGIFLAFYRSLEKSIANMHRLSDVLCFFINIVKKSHR